MTTGKLATANIYSPTFKSDFQRAEEIWDYIDQNQDSTLPKNAMALNISVEEMRSYTLWWACLPREDAIKAMVKLK